MIGTWLDGYNDALVEQFIQVDSAGIDTENVRAVSSYCMRHRLIRLFGLISRGDDDYHAFKFKFNMQFLPYWQDENEVQA